MKPIIILLLSLLPFGAFAGEPAPASAAGEPTVAELSAQLEALKAKTSTWDKIAARLPRISGYVQTGYEWSETSSTFFIKRVRLNLAGDIAENSTTGCRSSSAARKSSTPTSATGLSNS